MIYIIRETPSEEFPDGNEKHLWAYSENDNIGVPPTATKIMQADWDLLIAQAGSDAALLIALEIDTDHR